MIVDNITVLERDDGLIERSAVVRSARGEMSVFVAAPPELVDRSADASGFLAVTLPLAMRLGEDLRIAGPVSPRLLARCEDLQALYASWAPFTRRVTIFAEPDTAPDARGEADVAFFSRGVDSVFTAARDAAGSRRFTSLVFADGLEPLHDSATRADEMKRAAVQAERIGIPLTFVDTNVRALTGPIVYDWEDVCGAGLAFVALGLAGAARSMTIAATDTYESLEPAGTSPLLDPLFSTERTEIVHDTLAFSRLDKIRWLATHAPATIDDLKVCYEENRPDNCGRCGKCMITMSCLHLAGVLDQATQFPSTLDLDAIAAMRLTVPKALVDWAEIARLDDDHYGGKLRDAVRTALRNSVKRGHGYASNGTSLWIEPRSFRTHRMNLWLELLFDGEPYPDVSPRRPWWKLKRT